MSSRGQVAVLVLAMAFVLCSIRDARAQDSADSDYEATLSRALDAHARGEDESARVYMERAYALQPSARTLRGLGTIALAQGRTLEALRYLEGSLSSEVLPLTAELRAGVQALVEHALSQVGSYELRATPDDAAWTIDGAQADVYAPKTVALMPGLHTISVGAPGYVTQAFELDVKPGERRTLARDLATEQVARAGIAQESEPAAPRRTAVARAPEAEPARSFYTPTLRWIGLGTGGALLLGAAALWTVGYVKLHDIDDLCRNRTPSGCPRAEAQRLYDDRHIATFATSSAVLALSGAGMLATVAILEMAGAGSDDAPALRVGARGLAVSGRF